MRSVLSEGSVCYSYFGQWINKGNFMSDKFWEWNDYEWQFQNKGDAKIR